MVEKRWAERGNAKAKAGKKLLDWGVGATKKFNWLCTP